MTAVALTPLAVTRPMEADAAGPIADLHAAAQPEEAAIRSRWQHDVVAPWRRVEPTMVCEVRVTNLDDGRAFRSLPSLEARLVA